MGRAFVHTATWPAHEFTRLAWTSKRLVAAPGSQLMNTFEKLWFAGLKGRSSQAASGWRTSFSISTFPAGHLRLR